MPTFFTVPSVLRSTALCLLVAAPAAQASVVSGLRDYFDTLAATRPVQQASNLWTFHVGNHAGALMTPSGATYINASENPQLIGLPVNVGDYPCTSGFCNVPQANTQATFEGVFVHPGFASATAAVYHATQAQQLDQVELWSETIQNGANGNGFAVTVNAMIGGLTQSIGSFTFNYANTVSSKLVSLYTPGLLLGAGDSVEILYGPNGSYLYDHGNVNAWIRTSTPGQSPSAVPEPSSWALAALALLGLAASRRRAARR